MDINISTNKDALERVIANAKTYAAKLPREQYVQSEADCLQLRNAIQTQADLVYLLKSGNHTYLGGEYVICLKPDEVKKALENCRLV